VSGTQRRQAGCRACPRRASILDGEHDGDNRLAVVPGAAEGLEPDQGRRALPVVVAEVDAELDLRAVASTGGERQQAD
jgi:hypothetical protein